MMSLTPPAMLLHTLLTFYLWLVQTTIALPQSYEDTENTLPRNESSPTDNKDANFIYPP